MDTNSPDNPVPPKTASEPERGGDVLSVISDVERRLLALRDAHMETERTRTRVEHMERDLVQRAAEAAEQARQAATELETARAEREQLAARAAELQRERETLATERKHAQEELRAAEQMAAELEKEQDQLRRSSAEAGARTEAALREAEAGRAATDRLRHVEQELAEARASHGASVEAVGQLQARLDEALGTVARARGEGEAAAEAARALAQQSRREAEQATAQAAALEKELTAAREHAARTADSAGAQSKVAEAARADFEKRSRELSEAMEARAAEARKHGEQASKLRKDCEKQEAAIKRLEQALSAVEAEAAALKTQGAERAQELASTTQLLDKARTSGQRLEAENTALGTEIDKVRSQSQLLQQLLDEARADSAAAKARAEETTAALDGAKTTIEDLHRLPPDMTERVALRRRRMNLVRKLLREQQAKLRTAGDALRERFREAEGLLARREELATARAAMVQVQRKLDKLHGKAVRTKAATMTLAIVALLGLLGGISWGITTQIAPATYAVKAVIQADGRGRDLSEEELAEWRKFHTGLLSDPALMQAASQRMAARGITSLGTPGQLSARLKDDLHHTAIEDRLELELVGLGAARTTREMETFITSLVSHSSAGQDRRADGVATVITTAGDPGPGPIHDQRPMYAGIVFVVTALLASLLGFGMWNRLAAAKTRFEEEAQIDAAIDEANWGAAATFRGQ